MCIKIYLFMLFKKSKMFRECDQKNGSSANSQSTSALDETDPLISTEFLMLFALSGLHFKGTFSCSAVRDYTFVCMDIRCAVVWQQFCLDTNSLLKDSCRLRVLATLE